MRLGAMDETAIGILVDSIAREWDHSSEAYSSSYWTVRPATAKSRACKPPVIGANLYAVLCELLTLTQSSSHGSQVMVTRVI